MEPLIGPIEAITNIENLFIECYFLSFDSPIYAQSLNVKLNGGRFYIDRPNPGFTSFFYKTTNKNTTYLKTFLSYI